jgi:UDP-glucose 4-epimerase
MILVTGGSGFLGLHTARALTDAGEETLLTRYRTARSPSFLRDAIGGSALVEQVDVTDRDAVATVISQHKVTGVVHLAGPPRWMPSAVDEISSAVNGLLAVLDAAVRTGVRRVTVASSVRVYGQHPRFPVTEERALPPRAAEGIQAAKIAEEVLGSYVESATGVEVVSLRIAVVYGPCYRTLLNAPARMCHLALGHAERIAHLPDPLAAHPLDAADLCYVKDCARAISLVQLAGSLPERVYNVGAGRLTTTGELVAAVNRAVGSDLRLTADPPAAQDPGHPMDISRLERHLGYRPEWDLDRAVADYVRWLRHNEY